ncbi:MAG: flagella basal body P-ring formation protein FlgA [Candidatus Neomarinimicrobiota bacterium]|nr:MAG: flagella basal body P-ring formation protein FlgA [Candidatus Neomarinimicrobiota bacterium]
MLKKYIILILLLQTGWAQTVTGEDVHRAVQQYFGQVFQVPVNNVRVDLLHSWKTRTYPEAVALAVVPTQSIPEVGYQTVWIETRQRQLLQDRKLISVKVAVRLEVPVARERIPRHQPIDRSRLDIREEWVETDYRQLVDVTADLSSLVTNRVVPAGAILLKKYLQPAPDVWRDTPVRVRIVTEDLTLETEGITKKDGRLGERIHVYCPTTGKRLTGIVQSPDLVVVKLH